MDYKEKTILSLYLSLNHYCLIYQYFQFASPTFNPTTSHELLNRMTGGGLSATYRFTRTMSIFSAKMICIDITFTNNNERPIGGIRVNKKVWFICCYDIYGIMVTGKVWFVC